MPDNNALWLKTKQGPFTIGPAPIPTPGSNEIVVRVRAIAVNPMDRAVQNVGGLITPWIKYPFVPGSDVAGEVVAVGTGVSRFNIGDRVLGYAAGADKGHRAAEGAFQIFAVLLAHMASPLPERLSFQAAAVLPMGLSTAATGLFEQDCLALQHPSVTPRATGMTFLVWGGSTSVGSNAIQLAVAAGYDVIATSSPRNFEYVRRLGARAAFDYRSKTVVADIIKAIGGRKLAGALAIGVGAASKCLDVVGSCEGHRFVAMATPPATFDHVPLGRGRRSQLVRTLARIIAGNIGLAIKARRMGVRTKFIWGSALLTTEIGPMIYETFLPAALADGRFIAAPAPMVFGHGLDQIPGALDRQLQGVSAQKIVVTV